jgi:hypothetical protein
MSQQQHIEYICDLYALDKDTLNKDLLKEYLAVCDTIQLLDSESMERIIEIYADIFIALGATHKPSHSFLDKCNKE